MGMVTIYKINLCDALDDAPLISTRMATLMGAHIMGGAIVEGSGIDIEGSQLAPGAQWTPPNFSPSSRIEGQRKARFKRARVVAPRSPPTSPNG